MSKLYPHCELTHELDIFYCKVKIDRNLFIPLKVLLRIEIAQFFLSNDLNYMGCSTKGAWCSNRSKLPWWVIPWLLKSKGQPNIFIAPTYALSNVLKILLETVHSLFHNCNSVYSMI